MLDALGRKREAKARRPRCASSFRGARAERPPSDDRSISPTTQFPSWSTNGLRVGFIYRDLAAPCFCKRRSFAIPFTRCHHSARYPVRIFATTFGHKPGGRACCEMPMAGRCHDGPRGERIYARRQAIGRSIGARPMLWPNCCVHRLLVREIISGFFSTNIRNNPEDALHIWAWHAVSRSRDRSPQMRG